MPSALDGNTSALSRVANTVVRVLAVFGAFTFIYQAPVALSKEFHLSTAVKVTLILAFSGLTVLLFFCLWFREWLLDKIYDRPLPGFSKNSAEMVCKVGCHIIPDMPSRCRSKIAMAAGVCGVCAFLTQIITNLEYFASRRYKTFAHEVALESEFKAEALQRLVQMGVQLIQDLQFFRQFNQRWIELMETLREFPKNTCALIEETEKETERVVNDLNFLSENPNRTNSNVTEPERRQEMKQRFAKYEQDILAQSKQLSDLANSYTKIFTECQVLVQHLGE